MKTSRPVSIVFSRDFDIYVIGAGSVVTKDISDILIKALSSIALETLYQLIVLMDIDHVIFSWITCFFLRTLFQ
jgi:hypothetical protein